MSFRSWVVFSFAAATLAWADEVKNAPSSPPLPPGFPHPLPAETEAQPWLGVNLEKPDRTITAHLPGLPNGTGLIVESVVSGGPAETAGLAAPDVIWKLGDQILVNKGQLVTLLRLSKPGDEVSLSVFRAGVPLEIKLKLGTAPPLRAGFKSDLAEKMIMPGERGPVRLINIESRTTSFSDESGKAVVRREGDVYKATVIGADGAILFDGELPEDCNVPGLEKKWLDRICVLRRGLEHALESRMVPVRPPRPRVVPPAVTSP